MRMLFKHKIDPKAKLLPWQHTVGVILVPSSFEQHHSNNSRDILDFVIYLCMETVMSSVLNKNLNVSGTREDISEMKTPLFVTLKGLSNKHI